MGFAYRIQNKATLEQDLTFHASTMYTTKRNKISQYEYDCYIRLLKYDLHTYDFLYRSHQFLDLMLLTLGHFI